MHPADARRFRLRWILVFAFGVGLRLVLASGYGLGDDPGYFFAYDAVRLQGWTETNAYNWRFPFMVPVLLFMRAGHGGEMSFLAFVTLCSIVNLPLVYLLGRQEWGREGGLLAMAVLAVFPLDVLCSTLCVIDIPLATYCFGALWLYRAALADGLDARRRGALAAAAAVVLFLAYLTKQWAVLMGLLFAAEALRAGPRRWAVTLGTAGGFALLAGAYYCWQWLRFGDPFADIHLVRRMAAFVPLDRRHLLDYPGMLLLPTEYGTYFAGFHPHLLLLLAVVGGWRMPGAARWFLYTAVLLLALAAMPSHRENGVWLVHSPHIFRYLCLISIPLCLALAGQLLEVLRRWPAAGRALVAVLLGASVVHAVTLTAPTRDSFAEQRRAVALVRAQDERRVAADFDFGWRLRHFAWGGDDVGSVTLVTDETIADRMRRFRAIGGGLVVTGGARLPWYGCHRCTANLDGHPAPANWVLLATLDGPRTIYRREPLRLWRVELEAPPSRPSSPLDRQLD